MKKARRLLLIIALISLACAGCAKFDDESAANLPLKSVNGRGVTNPDTGPNISWIEEFNSSSSLAANWTLYGNPQPQWVNSAYGRQGLFDNNGPSPIKNYAVSHFIAGKGYGFTVESEVLLKILNTQGTCVCPGIGVSSETNPVMKNGEIETGISMRIIFAGQKASWLPAKLSGHSWLVMTYLDNNQTIQMSNFILADTYSNQWIRLKMVISPTRFVKFYCNNNLIWAPPSQVNAVVTTDKNVVLGYTSDGDPTNRAGVAYHNWVKVNYFFNNPAD